MVVRLFWLNCCGDAVSLVLVRAVPLLVVIVVVVVVVFDCYVRFFFLCGDRAWSLSSSDDEESNFSSLSWRNETKLLLCELTAHSAGASLGGDHDMVHFDVLSIAEMLAISTPTNRRNLKQDEQDSSGADRFSGGQWRTVPRIRLNFLLRTNER